MEAAREAGAQIETPALRKAAEVPSRAGQLNEVLPKQASIRLFRRLRVSRATNRRPLVDRGRLLARVGGQAAKAGGTAEVRNLRPLR